MACGDAVVHPNQFDPDSDPEEEVPEEIQSLRLCKNVQKLQRKIIVRV